MRNDWSQQSQRLFEHLSAHPGVEFDAPTLNRICASEGAFVSSLSKRISEVRARVRSAGMDLVRTKDEWRDGKRNTGYTLKQL